MNFKIFFILLLITGLAAPMLYAQDAGGKIESREIVIEKNRKIELPPATRVFDKPAPVPPANEPEVLTYEAREINPSLEPAPTSVKALVLKQDAPAKQQNNHLRLGFGNYITPYIEGFVNNGASKDLVLNARVRHFSSVNGPVENAGFSQNMFNVNALKYSDKFTAGAGINYSRDRYNFYGYDRERFQTRSKDSLKQVFNDISATVFLNNADKDALIDHRSSILLGRIADRYDASEIRTVYNGAYRYHLDSLVALQADVALHYYAYSQDSLSQGRVLFSITPKYVSNKGIFRYSAGVNLAYENDTLGGGSDVHLYPDLKAEYDLAPNYTLMAAVDGGMEAVSYNSLTGVMPFWDRMLPVFHTNRKLGISGALKMSPFKKVYVLTGLAFANYENFHFILNSPDDYSKFMLYYDTKTITRITYSLAAGYYFNEDASLKFDFKYHNYSVNTAQAWHLPGIEANASFRHNLYKKIYFTADVYYIGGLYAYDYGKEGEVRLKDILDVNLKIDYKLNSKLSAFIGAYNIIGNKYERYYRYNNKSVNLLAGFTYSF